MKKGIEDINASIHEIQSMAKDLGKLSFPSDMDDLTIVAECIKLEVERLLLGIRIVRFLED